MACVNVLHNLHVSLLSHMRCEGFILITNSAKPFAFSATKLKYSRHMGHKQSWWYKKCQQQQTLTVISVYSDNRFCWSLRLNCISHALGVTYCAINSITFKGHTVNVNCFGLLKVYSKWFRRVKKHLASFCKFNLIW